MVSRFGLLVVLVLSCGDQQAFAQQETYMQEGYLWQRYYFKGRLSERFMLHVETERRSLNVTRFTTQSLLPRIHVHYLFKNEVDVGLGVAHFMNYVVIPEHAVNRVARSEVRFHQELNFSQPFGRFRIQHRYQVEERLYMRYADERYVRQSLPFEYGFRFRYQLQFQAQLTPEEKKVHVFLKLFNELLLQASEARPHQLFEANRFYGGVNVKFSEVWALEVGYLAWIQQQTASTYFVPHIARFTLQHSIDFRKNKDV